jgi:hypothetical protein
LNQRRAALDEAFLIHAAALITGNNLSSERYYFAALFVSAGNAV